MLKGLELRAFPKKKLIAMLLDTSFSSKKKDLQSQWSNV
jgi:hypothetical protein